MVVDDMCYAVALVIELIISMKIILHYPLCNGLLTLNVEKKTFFLSMDQLQKLRSHCCKKLRIEKGKE